MNINFQSPNALIAEFNKLLDYHIRKLEQLVKIDQEHAFELKYMLNALKGSRKGFQDCDQPIPAIRDCIATIAAGQKSPNQEEKLLPIQTEILEEMEIFLLRYNLK